MAGLGAIAISTAPILGEALLAGAAGQLKGPDYRSGINQDLDLLEGCNRRSHRDRHRGEREFQ
jgi:hypothetical protein